MKTIRVQTAGVTAGIAMMLALAMPARGDTRVDARIQIRPRPTEDLQISVWPDRGEGASYMIGDPIAMNVEINRDCFLILYNIDTRGNLRILFPYDPWDDNLVRAGDVIRFPRSQDGYDWTVDGPEGTEYVQAIATEFPIDPPDWPVYMRSVNHGGAVCPDAELRDFRAGDNRLDYVRVVNRKIAGRYWDWCATDLATFYVHPRYYRHVSFDDDPWPDEFYGEVYIHWPAGGRIFIDDIYIGIAPLWIPRQYYGHHVITCYDGRRLVRRHAFAFHPKRDYRQRIAQNGYDAYRERGFVKQGRRGGSEQFDGNWERYRTKQEEYRREPEQKRADDRGMQRTERLKAQARGEEQTMEQPKSREPHSVEPRKQRETKPGLMQTVTPAVTGVVLSDQGRLRPKSAAGVSNKKANERKVGASIGTAEKSKELTGKAKLERSSNQGSSGRGKRR